MLLFASNPNLILSLGFIVCAQFLSMLFPYMHEFPLGSHFPLTSHGWMGYSKLPLSLNECVQHAAMNCLFHMQCSQYRLWFIFYWVFTSMTNDPEETKPGRLLYLCTVYSHFISLCLSASLFLCSLTLRHTCGNINTQLCAGSQRWVPLFVYWLLCTHKTYISELPVIAHR